MSRDAEGPAFGRGWLPASSVARRVGVTPAMVRVWMADGRLRSEWTPLGRVVDPASVDALVKAREASRGGSGTGGDD